MQIAVDRSEAGPRTPTDEELDSWCLGETGSTRAFIASGLPVGSTAWRCWKNGSMVIGGMGTPATAIASFISPGSPWAARTASASSDGCDADCRTRSSSSLIAEAGFSRCSLNGGQLNTGANTQYSATINMAPQRYAQIS